MTSPGNEPATGDNPTASSTGQPASTAGQPATSAAASGGGDGDVLVDVRNLVKHFPVRGAGLISRTVGQVQAVDGVSLTLRRGQTLGLVGETGCGKSTLARCIAGLIPATSGEVIFEGREITGLSRRAMQPIRREIQMIFQDPYGSLNPRRRVGSIIGDPFAVHNTARGNQRKQAVQELMERVGLNPEHYNRFPAPAADPDTAASRQRIILTGDIPSPINPPAGCRFHPRCPKAQDLCQQQEPPLETKAGDPPEHQTACHYPVQPYEDLTITTAGATGPDGGSAGGSAA